MITGAFGNVSERSSKMNALLKRTKPEQKLFGYPKKFLEDETKRLATGIREYSNAMENFIKLCKDFERDNERKVNAMSTHINNAQNNQQEARNYARKLEHELDFLRKNENSQKNIQSNLKNEITSLKEKAKNFESIKSTLTVNLNDAEECAARSLEKLDEQAHMVTKLEAQVNETKKINDNLKNQLEKADKFRLDSINELKLSSKSQLEKLSHDCKKYESNESKLRDEILILTERNNTSMKEFSELKEKMVLLEASSTKSQNEILILKASNDELQKQLKAKDDENSSKDNHFKTAMETFNSGQKFLQEQTVSLSADKARLEARLESLSASKSALDLELVEKNNTLKEITESKINLDECLDSTKKELVEAQESLDKFKSSEALLKDNLEDLARQLASQSSKSEKLKNQFEELEKKSKNEIEKLNEELNDANSQIKQLDMKCQDFDSELNAVRSSMKVEAGQEQMEKLVCLSKEAEILKKQVSDRDALFEKLAQIQGLLKLTEEKLFESDRKKRQLHNEVQSLKGKVRVIARIRPQVKVRMDHDGDVEMNTNLPSFYDIGVENTNLTLKTEQSSAISSSREDNDRKRSKLHSFSFDHVFRPSAKQETVFEEVSCFVQSALDGYNVCLFSYGQTGSGKTWTMTGDYNNSDNRGIIPRAIDQILSYQVELRARGWEYTLVASYVEIYNENILDLLASSKSSNNKKLEIQNSKKEILISNVTKLPMKSKEEIKNILELAARNRSVAATNSNIESSRSHSVFTLFIEGKNKDFNAAVQGSLSLCDLAGSERIARSGAEGDRLKEAQNINKSLSSLANVFSSLHSKSAHIPYRNSKLTHMLQPCFAGEGKAMMIVNLSPETDDKSESLCSLRFAGQVSSTELGRAKKQISKAS